jgi:hypothetical protein
MIESCTQMDRTIEECTTFIYDDEIEQALVKIASANTILNVS